jgi:NAD-dependent deacetylase
MVVVGTSGSVYPAANFVHWARQAGARTVYVGPEPPEVEAVTQFS